LSLLGPSSSNSHCWHICPSCFDASSISSNFMLSSQLLDRNSHCWPVCPSCFDASSTSSNFMLSCQFVCAIRTVGLSVRPASTRVQQVPISCFLANLFALLACGLCLSLLDPSSSNSHCCLVCPSCFDVSSTSSKFMLSSQLVRLVGVRTVSVPFGSVEFEFCTVVLSVSPAST
jgi:hypothetical protein